VQGLTAERNDDRLTVRWAAADRPERVVVSPSPDEPHALDHATVEVADDHVAVALDGLPGRIYVHLFSTDGSHVVVAERLVPMEGTRNFRDLGGYRGLDGRRVRWGRVYRSDGLATLTDLDLGLLRDLGVKVVCDFRSDREHTDAPSKVAGHGSIELLGLPISDGSDAGKALFEQIADRELTRIGVDEMAAYYVLTLDANARRFGEVLDRIADPSQHAVVFHCTAGKDRTGMLAALLLSVLGVDDATILHDYELTNGYRAERRAELLAALEQRGIELADFLPFFTAVPSTLAASLDHLRATYGSVDGYLVDRAGLTPATIDALRSHLLV
jgi:protein-tyrosine phosphatase